MAKDYYAKGFNAFLDGKKYYECPYDYRSSEGESWMLGWEDAEEAAYNKSYPNGEEE